MRKIVNLFEKISKVYSSLCTSAYSFAMCHPMVVLGVCGVALLSLGVTQEVWAAEGAQGRASSMPRIREACGALVLFLEGPFGALICAGAGIGAICAAAFGGFKMAWTLVIISVGAFILRSYISLFFGTHCTDVN